MITKEMEFTTSGKQDDISVFPMSVPLLAGPGTLTLSILLFSHTSDAGGTIAVSAAVIVGREITISALREWMSEIGELARVKVSWVGKIKTGFQMTSIGFLLYREDLLGLPIALIGELLLFTAAALTLWSMYSYLDSAWPVISDSRYHRSTSDIAAEESEEKEKQP